MITEALIMLGISVIGSLVWLRAGGIDYIGKTNSDHRGENFFDDQDRKEIS